MSRTYRTIDHTRDGKSWDSKNRRPWHSCEDKPARKGTNRVARKVTRTAIRTATDFDDLLTPPSPATSGWMAH